MRLVREELFLLLFVLLLGSAFSAAMAAWMGSEKPEECESDLECCTQVEPYVEDYRVYILESVEHAAANQVDTGRGRGVRMHPR